MLKLRNLIIKHLCLIKVQKSATGAAVAEEAKTTTAAKAEAAEAA